MGVVGVFERGWCCSEVGFVSTSIGRRVLIFKLSLFSFLYFFSVGGFVVGLKVREFRIGAWFRVLVLGL